MKRLVTSSVIIIASAIVLAVPAPAIGQVELDRTLSRVYGAAVMTSDVRQAKLLRLVPEAGSDEAIQTALENRLLMLRETSLNEKLEPSKEAIEARKDAWRKSWPPGTDLPALLVRAGKTDQELDGWFRDELRIAAHLDLRFGKVADRSARVVTWIGDLRRRANLPAK